MEKRDSAAPPAQDRATAEAGGARRLEDLGQDTRAARRGTLRATVGIGRAETGSARRPAFDAHHPPAQDLIDDCVHCGFCLPTCPTYVLFGEEMDSPRGRIYLMKQGREGEALNDAMARHVDLCLGCLACVTACPSGVQYDKLIEATRQQVERRYARRLDDKMFRALVFSLFPYPERLRLLIAPLWLYQRLQVRRALNRAGLLTRLPARMQALESLAPDVARKREAIPARAPAQGPRRRTVGLLSGCVQRVFFPGVNAATVRVLVAEGCTVVAPRGQGCCGALSMHAGREAEAQRFARKTIDIFDAARVDTIVVNAAGCGSTMKDYGYLLRDDPAYAGRARAFSARVRDASELLDELGPAAVRHPLPVAVVYHDACHLAHGQGVRRQPRGLLQGIPDLELKEVPREREICCGSAGTYNLFEPGPAMELGDRKARAVRAAGARMLVTANPGCALHIQAALARMGQRMPMAHPMEVLDASIRGRPAASLLR